jgi:hypothetical protein
VNPPIVQVMVRMPSALRDELKKVARDRDLTMSQAVRRAVRQWLEYGDIGRDDGGRS